MLTSFDKKFKSDLITITFCTDKFKNYTAVNVSAKHYFYEIKRKYRYAINKREKQLKNKLRLKHETYIAQSTFKFHIEEI